MSQIRYWHEKLVKKEISALELTQKYLDQIDKEDPKVQAYLQVHHDHALEQARIVDERIARHEGISMLNGIPSAIKDNMHIQSFETSCASKILKNYQAPFDATIIEKLKSQHAVFLGKTNMDEFAMGSSTENSAFQKTKNPRNLDCVPGGSSGGSAAAVAGDMAVYAIGSDTGGSIRQPASFCGIVGFKPSYGRVSRYGLVAFASSLDQIGPLTSSVEDAAIVSEALFGFDPKDSTSVKFDTPKLTDSLKTDVSWLKIAVPKELLGEGIDPDVKAKVLDAVKLLEKRGAKVQEIEMPSFKYALSTYYLVATSEASANLARFDGVRFGFRANGENLTQMYEKTRGQGFGPEVKRRIMLGTYALSSGYYDAFYLKAQKVRTLIKQDYQKAFNDFHVIISPTSPTVAFKFGEKTENPLSMYLSDIATIPVNLAGLPAISIPCGVSKGLPVGIQITSRAFDESTLFQVAFALEQALK